MRVTEETMNQYCRDISAEIGGRIRGMTHVDFDPIRDVMHIATERKGRRYDWIRTKASECVTLGVPPMLIAAAYTDSYHDYIVDIFFKEDGTNTTKIWKEGTQIMKGAKGKECFTTYCEIRANG